VSEDEVPEVRLADVRRIAMDLLARREHTLLELRRKLDSRGLPAELVETALAQLTGEGLISEQRFAESFVGSRARRGQGPVRIRGELLQRGVDEALADQALDDAGCDWVELAREVRGKRFGRGMPESYPERARQSRFLQYRGFTGEQIRAAFGDN